MSDILFISDLHLSPERPDIIQLCLSFLDKQAARASQLYILGDLVEYWLGDDNPDTGIEVVFDKLKQLSDQGLQIFLMHGNRDFLMGEALAKRCGCQLIDDPYIADLNGEKVLLMHGDTLCTDDTAYQQLRCMLRDPAWQQDFLSKSIDERQQMAQALRERSQQETSSKDAEIMDVNADAVDMAFREHGIRLMIHGHTHRPNIHHYNKDGQQLTRIVLGDWYKKGSYLRFENSDKYQLIDFD